MPYHSFDDILKKTKTYNEEIWQTVLKQQARETLSAEDSIFEAMTDMYSVMKSTLEDYSPELRSNSGMAGGDGEKLRAYNQRGNTLLGDFLSEVMENAVKTAESNACMKRIVAAPTAGSCGVLPAVFITYQKFYKKSDEEMTKAMLIAAGIGVVIAENASISGAQGGCQAEIGSAAAMAAGGLAYLEGGDAEAIIHAAALTLKNMLGLTCDPVAGLVEVPCIKRNAIAAVNAVSGAQLSLAGIRSIIPPDEVVTAMYEIGCNLPRCLKETSEGGLATTPTGIKISKNIK